MWGLCCSGDTRLGWEPAVAGVLGADGLPARVVGGPDGLGGGDLRRQLRDALGRRAGAESAVRAVVVVEALPSREMRGEVGVPRVDGGPELLERGALDPLDPGSGPGQALAVQVRRARPVGPELDPAVPEPVLDLVGEELLAAVGLHPLHRERHLGGHAVEERQGVGGRPAREDAEDLEARAVVDDGVPVEAWRDLAGVHLHPVARDRPAVAPGALPLEAGPLQPVLAVADEDLVDGVERQPQPVPAGELVPEHLDAELALAAQAQDQRLLLGEDLAVGRAVRPVAARLEADLALGPVAAPPLPERRTGDAAPAADEAGVADPLVEPDPAQPRAR